MADPGIEGVGGRAGMGCDADGKWGSLELLSPTARTVIRWCIWSMPPR